jgi:hypothetical protein
MTSIPLILHYQPTLHLLTNLIQFCLILPGPYILAQNLNPTTPYFGTEGVPGISSAGGRQGHHAGLDQVLPVRRGAAGLLALLWSRVESIACAGDWAGTLHHFLRAPAGRWLLVRRPHAPGRLRLRLAIAMVQCSARCCPVALSPDQGGGQPDTAAATGEPGQVCSMLGKGPSVAGARDRWSRCCFIIVHALLGGVLRCRSKLDRPVRSGSARPAGRPATATPSSVPSPGWHAVRPRTPRARACLLARVWAGARAVLRRARPAQPSGGRG